MRRLAVLATLFTLGIGSAVAQPPPNYAPVPPPRYEAMPPPRGERFVWQPGHWHWNGYRYVWFPGTYIERRPYYHHWVEGHWVWAPRFGRYVWERGHWN
jgi:hypothetical protein